MTQMLAFAKQQICSNIKTIYRYGPANVCPQTPCVC